MTVSLDAAECAFFYAALGQIEPGLRDRFVEMVANNLGALTPLCVDNIGPGDIDRAVRNAFASLWTPPLELSHAAARVSRWHRSRPNFARASKRAG